MRALLSLSVLSHSPFRTFCPRSGGRQPWSPSGLFNSLKNIISYRSLWGNSRHRSPTWVPGPNVIPDPRGSPPPPGLVVVFHCHPRRYHNENPQRLFLLPSRLQKWKRIVIVRTTLHGPSSRRRSTLRLTSPFGMDVVSEVVVVIVVFVEAVVAIGAGQIATSVPVSAALGCLQPPPAHPVTLLLTGVTVFLYLISLESESAALQPKLCAAVNPVTGSDLISVW